MDRHRVNRGKNRQLTLASKRLAPSSNDAEEISSQSYAGESGDYSYRSYRVRKANSSSSSRRPRRTDDDTEDYFSGDRSTRSYYNRRNTATSDSVDDIITDDVYTKRSIDLKRSKKRRKSRRREEQLSYSSAADREFSVKESYSSKSESVQSNRKGSRGEKANELPITDILKKAQEQRTRYEEPAPLPQLTSNTVYVQGQNGFNAVKIGDDRAGRSSQQSSAASSLSSRPIKVAVIFQKLWRGWGFIFQGLLGGMAMLHFIFMENYFDYNEEFVNNYSTLSEIYSSVFSFMIFICVVSTFDKFDVAYVSNKNHFGNIMSNHLKCIMALPLYIGSFALHQLTLGLDDKLSLIHHSGSNVTYYSQSIGNSNDTLNVIRNGELKSWQRMTISKDALAVLAWIFVSFDNQNMLLNHLQAMSKRRDPS